MLDDGSDISVLQGGLFHFSYDERLFSSIVASTVAIGRRITYCCIRPLLDAFLGIVKHRHDRLAPYSLLQRDRRHMIISKLWTSCVS